MEIPCEQDYIMKSGKTDCDERTASQSCRRTNNGFGNKRRLHLKLNLPAITTILLLCVSATNALAPRRCPQSCSCPDDSFVLCNNNGYKTFPNIFLPSVRKLHLFNNNITKIPKEAMRSLTNLTLLDISGNRITNYALWDGVFNRLKHLDTLMLQQNMITEITAQLFRGMTSLLRIYLQDNEISRIEPGSFDNLPNLIELKLLNNKLVSFPRLQGTPSLLLIDLSHNRLTSIRDMALATVNLEQLQLEDNLLSQLRTSIFDDTSRLRHLDISNNRLTAVPKIIKSLTNLISLNMSVNRIDAVPADTFKDYRQLRTLDLHDMKLTSLQDGIFPPNIVLNVLDISNNDWDCTCGIKWFPMYINLFEEAFENSDNIRCATPHKYRNQKVKDISGAFADCPVEDEPRYVPPVVPAKPITPRPDQGHKSAVDPCDVFKCFNGGECRASENELPRCICPKDWAGLQCRTSLTTPTTSTTTTTRKTTTRKSSGDQRPPPSLLVDNDSITETSVEIILPQTNTELLVAVSEIGRKDETKELRITPQVHRFKVKGLEAGKAYNICVLSPLVIAHRKDEKDLLCANVKTKGDITVVNSPYEPEDRVVSPVVDEPPTESDKSVTYSKARKPGDGDQQQGGQPVTSNTDNSDFQIIYPVLGAGLGAVIIIVMVISFFFCYRQKRLMRLKKEGGDAMYTSGNVADTTPSAMTDIELATVVHHHHHNHYTAAGQAARDGKKLKTSSASSNKGKPPNYAKNNVPPRRVSTPNKTSSLGRSSSSSNSNCGTLQTRYVESPQLYPPQQTQYIPVGHLPHPKYDVMPPNVPINGRANDFVYRNHQNNNNSVLPVSPTHCIPQGRVYETDMYDEMQPLVAGGYHYNTNDPTMFNEGYPVGPQYIPQTGGVSYPQVNSRSAFQPIQSPRKNSVRTPTSDSGPITTHVNTAHVLPTSTCMSRNMVNESIPIYREGVPVA